MPCLLIVCYFIVDTIDEIESKHEKESLSSHTGREQVPSTTGPQSTADPAATVSDFLSIQGSTGDSLSRLEYHR